MFVVRGLLGIGAAALAALAGKKYLEEKERAAALQRAFMRFHERIRHEQFGERDLLRERRETLQARLAEALNQQLRPRLFHQGSYALQTGVKPLTGEFDIDLGLVLECRRSTFASPIEAKRALRDALRQGSRRVRIRRSCVTVEYKNRDLGDYHVDLALYVREPDGKFYLAKGKEHSEARFIVWDPAAPEELTSLLNSKFKGPAIAQFRRCVRYFKRWKQVNFNSKVPFSIALTVAVYWWFEPVMDGVWEPTPNDLDALLLLIEKMRTAIDSGRLRVVLPVTPGVDLMEQLTAAQMTRFLDRLDDLHAALQEARTPSAADGSFERLATLFGPEFL